MKEGKLPPQSVDLEEAVLGAMLLDREAVHDVSEVLLESDFYKEDHQIIYRAIMALSDQHKPIDILTCVEQLKAQGDLERIGGAITIAQLTNRVASGAHSEAHARIIKQHSLKRQVIKIGSDMIRDAYDDQRDVFELLEYISTELMGIDQQTAVGSILTMPELMKQQAMIWKEKEKSPDKIIGVASGFRDLDLATGGFSGGNMITIAGRPGMGKTTIALQMAKNAVATGKRVGIVTLEMTALELFCKIMSSHTQIPFQRLMKQVPDHEDFTKINDLFASKLNAMGIYFVDRGSMTTRDFKVECRRLVRVHRCDAIILDYIQLMNVQSNNRHLNREGEVSLISRTIKGTAKELDVPIISLSQLNRSVETRGGAKRPMLSDLRESGSIEQDSDMVIFAYRPEYYGFDMDEEGMMRPKGFTELIIAKHRGGETLDLPLIADLEFSIVRDYDNRPDPFAHVVSGLGKPDQRLPKGDREDDGLINQDGPPF